MLPYRIVVDMGHGPQFLRTTTLTKVEFINALPDQAYAMPAAPLTDFSISGRAPQTQIPFRLINNHIYGVAQVNGRVASDFIFDTGGRNIITPDLARALNLKVEGRIPVFGAGEGVMEGGFTHMAEIRIGDAAVTDQLFTVIPLDRVAALEGTPKAGLIGYEVFRRFVTRIDYGAGMITLIDPEHFSAGEAGTPVKFVFHDHIPEIAGTFEGLPARFNIDTGARFELSLTKSFVDQGGLRAKHPRGVDAVNGWGVGGPLRAYITRGAEMTLGPIRLADVVTGMSNENRGGGGLSGSIGGGVLKRFVVTFDYDHQTMYLKPRPAPVADTGTFDRSGMWVNVSPNGFEVVDITKGGPAEEAGLKAGDTILDVDGRPVNEIHLYALRERLRNDPPGTVVTFRVKSGPEVRPLTVALRDLV
jgi:Aspartyl protease/PDZ domain